jgi:superfamily I DNA/RNA helicase
MIQHRIDTVWARFQPSQDSPKLDMPEAADGIEITKFLDRTLPPANIETFSILLLHYTRRGDNDMIRYLNKCLGDAQIRPNSYFMNHLLYAELRKHNIDVLWRQFKSMTAYVRPDLETFACLWDCGKLQYDRSRKEWDPEFPSARQLFSLMMQWFSTLNPHAQQQAQAEFSKELYDQITLCFCLSKDLAGTLVSLYAMRDLFGYFPDDQTARMLVLQITRLAVIPAKTKKARRRLFAAPNHKEKVQTVHSLLQVLESDKAAMLQEQGLTVDQLSDEERKQYQLEILSDLLVSVMERTVGEQGQVKEEIAVAMQEMGISLDLPLLGSGL